MNDDGDDAPVKVEVAYEDNVGAQRRSAKYKRQMQHLQWERDPMLMVLRGHLYVEQQLNYLVSHRVPGEVLRALNLPFSRKLHLARKLGIVSDETNVATARLNELRNRLAHNLDGEVDDAEIESFYVMLERNGLFEGSDMQRAENPIVTLSRCIRAVYAMYGADLWTLRSGKQAKIRLMSWVTREMDEEMFDENQRTTYEHARRLQAQLDGLDSRK